MAAIAATLVYHVRTAAVRASLRPMVSRIGGSRDDGGSHSYIARSGGDIFEILMQRSSGSREWIFQIGDRKHEVITPDFEFYRRRLKLTIDGQVHRFRMKNELHLIFVVFSGITRLFEVYRPKEWELLKYMPARTMRPADNVLVCPMPGLVVDVLANKGDRVFRGQNLVVLESMKMESGVASPTDGIIDEIRAVPGQAVETGDILIRFKADNQIDLKS